MNKFAAISIVGSFASLIACAFAGCGGSGQGLQVSLEGGGNGADETGVDPDSGGTSSGTGTGTGTSSGAGSSSTSTSTSGSTSGVADATAEATEVTDAASTLELDSGLWALSWSDEFDLPDGSPPDPSKWNIDTGGDGFGNQELEYYTTNSANVQVGGGNLVITAMTNNDSSLKCNYPNMGNTCLYSSGKIDSKAMFSQLYGRFEARIKIPAGQGMWPAFWALGVSGGWPQCGEIDIMENRGSDPATNYGSLHGPRGGGAYQDETSAYTLPGGAKLSDGFHLYAIEWEPNVIRFYVDNALYVTRTKNGVLAMGDTWPFTQPNYLIFNLAVGGMFGGDPNSSTVFPQSLLVDYVRVYTRVGADY